MKTVKVTTGNKISVIEVNFRRLDSMQEAVGGHIETVMSERLSKYFKQPAMMIVDEEGRCKGLPVNRLGCFFYGTVKHGQPIVGDLFLAVSAGEDIIGLDDAENVKKRLMKDFEFLWEEKSRDESQQCCLCRH